MANQELSSALSLVQDFAKASVAFKKAGVIVARTKEAKDQDVEKTLRKAFSELHDRLFEKIRSLDENGQLAVYAMVKAYATSYNSQLNALDEEYSVIQEKIKTNTDYEKYLGLSQRLDQITAAKTDAKYYFDTYIALQHYISGFSRAVKYNNSKK